MKRTLLAVLAAVCASVVAVPAQAINEYWTGALLGAGAVYVFDRLPSRQQSAYGSSTNHGGGVQYPRPIAGRQPATIYCPPNTVSYDYRTNICHGPAVTVARPAVRLAPPAQAPATAMSPGEIAQLQQLLAKRAQEVLPVPKGAQAGTMAQTSAVGTSPAGPHTLAGTVHDPQSKGTYQIWRRQ